MPIPVIAADSTRWGGTVTVRRRALDSSLAIRAAQVIVGGDPNRVAWLCTFTTPGIGVPALPLGIVQGEQSGQVAESIAPGWVLRANGDFLELDVRIDSDMAIRPFYGFWMPTFTPDLTGQQHVEVWEYVRVHGGETPENAA